MKTTKRLLALLLVMAMMMSNLAVAATAAEIEPAVSETTAATVPAETTEAVEETEAAPETTAEVTEVTEAATAAAEETEATEAVTEPSTEATEAAEETEAATEPEILEEDTVTAPVLDAAAEEISLWVYPIGEWSNAEKVAALLAEFEEAYGTKVNVTYLDYATGDDKVYTAIANGTTPDLILEGPERLVHSWGDHMLNIADLFDSDDKSQIYSNVLAACYADASTARMYPLAVTTHCMAINKTVFEAAGAMKYIDQDTHTWTTNNFLRAMEMVYAYTGKQVGAVYCGGQGGDQGTRALVTNLYGGSFTDAAHTRYTWDTESMVAALELLTNIGALKFDPAIVGGDEISLFRNGTLNMAFCWNIAQQQSAGTTLSGDEIMFLSFPSSSGTDAKLQGGIYGFGAFENYDASRAEAAKNFIKWYCDSEATADAVKLSKYFPARTNLTTGWTDDPVMTEYHKLTPMMGDYYQVTPNWSEARTAWWNMLQHISAGDDVAAAAAEYTAMANGESYDDGSDDDTTAIASGTLSTGHTWRFDASTGTLTIDGEGDDDGTEQFDTTDAPWAPYWDQILVAKIGEGIGCIGNNSFKYATNLTTVYLPSTLHAVFHEVFLNCSKITDVYTAQTQRQWYVMVSSDDGSLGSGNDYLVNANIHTEKEPAMLTYRWVHDGGEGWNLDYFDPSWSSEGYNGWGWGIQRTPVEDTFLIFYLNTWNSTTNRFDYTPVNVEAGPYLTLQKIKGDPNYAMHPEAVDPDYYYRIDIDDDAWNKTSSFTYNYNGEPLTIQVDLCLPESGMYTGPAMTPENFTPFYSYSQTTEEAALYYGYQNDHWTLKDIAIEVRMDTINGYDPADAVSTEKLDNGMYKITLDPWFVKAALWADLHVIGTLQNAKGDIQTTDYWHSLNCNIDERNIVAALTIDGRWYEFAEDGTAYSFEVDETRTWEDGNPVVLYSPAELPAGFSYNPSTNTITLNNASLNQLHISNRWDEGINGQMLPNENVTINLVGSSTISSTTDTALRIENAKVTFTGDGSVSLKATNNYNRNEDGDAYGFSTIEMRDQSTLIIAGNAKVTAEIAGDGLESCWEDGVKLGERPAYLSAIAVDNGDLTIKDNGYLKTIVPKGSRVNGPKIENEEDRIWGDAWPGGHRGIADALNVNILGGTLITNDLLLGNRHNHDGSLQQAGTYTQSGGSVTIVSTGGIYESEKWVHNDETGEDTMVGIVPSYNYYGLGNHQPGSIEITGGSLNITTNATEEEKTDDMAHAEALFTDWGGGSITISGGTVTINTNIDSDALHTGELNISGGTVDTDSGIYALNTMNISGGTVTGKVLNINDCDLTISGNADITVDNMVVGFWWIQDDPHRPGNGDGSLNVTGGKLTVNGDMGLWPCSNGVDITGGEVVFNGPEGGISGFAPLNIAGNAKVTFQDHCYWFNHNTVTIGENALITVLNSDFQVHDSINDDGSIASEGKFIVDGGKLVVNATRTDPEHMPQVMFFDHNSELIINGGEIDITAKQACDFGYEWTSAVLIRRGCSTVMNGGKFTVNSEDFHVALHHEGDLTLNDGVMTVTNTNAKDGITYNAASGSVNVYNSIGLCLVGYTNIEGGELNVTGANALDWATDPGNPDDDWPAWTDTKFTLNNGTVNVNGTIRGISGYSPAELNGGSLNVHITGMLNPHPEVNRMIGQALNLWYNDFEDAPTYLTINDGNHSFTADTGDNYSTYGAIVDLAQLTINGGNVQFEGKFALTGMNGRTTEDVLILGDGMYVIDNNTGLAKDMVTGTYLNVYQDETGAERTQNVYFNAFVEDNNVDPEDWWFGREDACTSLLITSEYDSSREPVLTYRWIDNHDEKWIIQDYNPYENEGKYGHSHMRRVPGVNHLAFYLNIWNDETMEWEATPVNVTPGEYITMKKMAGNGYEFAEGAEDTAYYYEVTLSEDGWDKESRITYNYMGDELEVIVVIGRDEDGWYNSTIMNNDTYLDHEFIYDQMKPENNVFYFGMDSDYWTLNSARFMGIDIPFNNYDGLKAVTAEKISDTMYKLTLDPELVSLGVFSRIEATITATDPEGEQSSWKASIGIHPDFDARDIRASFGVNDVWYQFSGIDGGKQAYTHYEHPKYVWPEGDTVYCFGPVDMPEGISYDLASNTITLNNATIRSMNLSYRWYDENTGDSGFDLPSENLTVKLMGTNTVSGTDYSQFGLHIYGGVKATFTGNGTLNIDATYPNAENYPCPVNIHGDADVYIGNRDSSPTISVTTKLGFDPGEEWHTAIGLNRGCSLTINNGTLSMHSTGYRTTFWSGGEFTINGGTVNITNVNDKSGIHEDPEVGLYNYWNTAASFNGLTNIYGGTMNINGYAAMELGYDAGNPDEGIEPNNNVLLTMTGGKLNLTGRIIGLSACTPALIKGGSINAHISGTYQPTMKKMLGYGLEVYYNGMIDNYFKIEGGDHSFTTDFGDNSMNMAAILSHDFYITGGTVLFKAPRGVVSETIDKDHTELLHVAEDMYIIDQINGKAKSPIYESGISKGVDQEGNPVERTFYIGAITKDDTLDIEKYMEGEYNNACTALLVTSEYTAPSADTKLENAADSLTDPDEIRSTVQDMGTEELKDALENNESAAEDLAALEEKVGGAADVVITEDAPTLGEGDASITGANLNDLADEKDTTQLVIDKVETEREVGEDYNADKMVQFSMTLTNIEDVKNLDVPVKITLPLPAHIDPALAVFLHYNSDGSIEVLIPTIFKVGDQYYASIVVTGFSDFVITERSASGVQRIAGDGRYLTAIAAAGTLKDVLGIEKFDSIIIASGTNFADALAGSYLAAVKSAPILLHTKKSDADNLKYVTENLASSGTVYILGGTSAVGESIETLLKNAGISVNRLEGKDRYLTNLKILDESGITGNEILVATAQNFADSLSASATGKPILLVNSKKNILTAEQKAWLAELKATRDLKLTIIGGTGAVSETLEEALSAYGTISRIYGSTRMLTSVKVAETYFTSPKAAFLAYSGNFPDGLCGGPVAYALGAPLLLVNAKKEAAPAAYVAENGIQTGYILGGTGVVSDESARIIFQLDNDYVIEAVK